MKSLANHVALVTGGAGGIGSAVCEALASSGASVRALHALMRRTGNALVVNISSIAAHTAMGSNVMYCASKAALEHMTKSLARARRLSALRCRMKLPTPWSRWQPV